MDEKLSNDMNLVLNNLADVMSSLNHPSETILIYCDEVRRFLLWWSGRGNAILGGPLVTRDDIKTYKQEMEQSRNPVACNQALAALRILFSFFQKDDKSDSKPTLGISNVWDIQKAYAWLDKEQQHLLESAIDLELRTPLDLVAWQDNRIRAAALVRFLLHTGMRASETRMMRLGDVRLGEIKGVVDLRERQGWQVEIDPPTCAALKIWLEIRPIVEANWLWIDKYEWWSGPISDNAILRACWRLAEFAGLPPRSVTPRILRNTCAYNLLMGGLTPAQVKRRLRFSATKYVKNYFKIGSQ